MTELLFPLPLLAPITQPTAAADLLGGHELTLATAVSDAGMTSAHPALYAIGFRPVVIDAVTAIGSAC